MSKSFFPLSSTSYQLEELPLVIEDLFPLLKKYKTLALHGDLGAGKTTFTSQLCRYLKTEETATSPTFSLINQYIFKDENGKENLIYHTDWYRLEDEIEASRAGIEDMLEENYFLCIIEWPENAASLVPENTLHLWFEVGAQPNERIIHLTETWPLPKR